jgi:DNA-binding response OmpR family regulator
MKKLFILDDNEELLEIMDRVLAPQFEVTTCSDKAVAMAIIGELNPDLIILDYFIGKSKAEDIVSQLRTSDSSFSVPIVLFSGFPHIKEVADQLGVAGYLEKPSSISVIRAYITDILEKAGVCG